MRFGAILSFSLGVLSLASTTPALFGQFLESRGSATVTSLPTSIAVGDFNGDGRTDIAVTATYEGQVAVLLGNGDGTFKPATYYAINQSLNGVVSVDLRSVGILDLAVATNDGGVYVLLGNGDGTFAAPISYPTVAKPSYIAVGDFTNSGHPGIVALTYGTDNCSCIAVLPGNGDGTLGAPIFTHNVGGTVALAVGNFTGGHNLDVAVALETGFNVYLGKGDGTFSLGNAYAISSPPGSIASASFRKNGILDLAVSLPFGGGVAVYLGNGDGTFTEGETAAAGFATPAITGDLNGDGYPDLIALTGYPNLYLTTFLNNGDGTFQAGVNYPLNYGGVSLATADFNGDGKADIAISDNSGNAVDTMLNTGVVGFSPASPISFKKQKVGTKSAPQTVTLTNTGKRELKISAMKVSAQFGMATTCAKTVAAGAACTISVTFSPTSKGPKSGTVTINDSASSKPQVIALSGTGA